MILIGNCDKVLSVNKQNGIVTCVLFKTEKEKKKKSEVVEEDQEEDQEEEINEKKKTGKKKDIKIIDYTLVGDLCDAITSPLLTFEIEVEEKKKNYYEIIKILEVHRPTATGGITVEYIKKKAKDSSMFYLKGVSTKERNKRITSTFDKISTVHGISPKTSTITDASLLRCVLTNSNENTLNQFNLDTRYLLRNIFKSDMFFTTFCTNLGVIFMMKMEETEEDIFRKKDVNECILLIKKILFFRNEEKKVPFSTKTIDFLIEYLDNNDNNIKEQLEGIRLGNNLLYDVIYNEKVRLNSVLIKQNGETSPYDINDSTMAIIETCCTNSIRMTSSPGVRDVYLQTVFTFELERQFIRAITSTGILEYLELINVQKDNLYEERNNEYITFLRKIEARKTSIAATTTTAIPEIVNNRRYQLTDSQKVKLKEDSIRTSNTVIIAPARKIYNLRKNFENCNILDFDSLFKPSTVTLERWPKDQNGYFKVKQDAIDYLMNQLGIQITAKPNIMDDNNRRANVLQPYVIIIEWCNSYSTRELVTAFDIIYAATLLDVGIDKMRNRQLEKIYLSGNINCYPESPGKPFTDLYRAIDCHGKNVKLNNFNTFSDNDSSPFSLYFANVDDLYNHFDISKGSGKVHSSSIDFICNCYRKSNELPPTVNNNNNKRKHLDGENENEEEEYNTPVSTTTTFPILDKWNALTFKSFSSLKYVDPPREYVIVNLKCKDVTSNELEKAIFCSPSRKANFIALGTPNDYKRIIVENSGVSRKRYYQRDRESCLEIDLSWNLNK